MPLTVFCQFSELLYVHSENPLSKKKEDFELPPITADPLIKDVKIFDAMILNLK